MNTCILLGRLTKDPELRASKSGTKTITTFRLAVDRNGSDDADFFDIVCFDNLAEACADHIRKGRQVLVDGSLRQQTWETPEGERRSKVEVIARRVQFLAKPSASVPNGAAGDTDDNVTYSPDEEPY